PRARRAEPRAAARTPSSRPSRSAARSTAAAAARPSARSTRSCSTSKGGAPRAGTRAPPPAFCPAMATAAPSPDAPPVTSTAPGRSRTGPSVAVTSDDLLHQLRGRAAFEVGKNDGLAAPALQQGGLRKLRQGVVPALGEHTGPQPPQHRLRCPLG